jgi:menaquinone-dependent protoporphyrinogen oxidase
MGRVLAWGGDLHAAYAGARRRRGQPRDEAFFAGKVDPAALSFFERLALKMVKSPVGDKRDWNAVRTWADGLAARLQ